MPLSADIASLTVATRNPAASSASAPPSCPTSVPASFHAIVSALPSSFNIQSLTPIQRSFFGLHCSMPLPRATLISATGSGKTLAYLLPILDLILRDRSFLAVVVVPTRELSAQIWRVFKAIARNFAIRTRGGARSNVRSVCLAGGGGGEESDTPEDVASSRPSFVVGTPGRTHATLPGLEELGRRPCLLVLDEYDRLLSANFAEDVDGIRYKTNPAWRWYVSATWKEIEGGGGVMVRVKKGQNNKEERGTSSNSLAVDKRKKEVPEREAASSSIPPHITQILTVTSAHKRPEKLMTLLAKLLLEGADRRNKPRCIVFFAQISELIVVSAIIERQAPPYSFTALHGKQRQDKRNKALAEFRAGKYQLLLTTDVMARGLDVKGLGYVVNYDFPGTIEQYIHRCGRVGRGKGDEGIRGVVYTYFDRKFEHVAEDMVRILEVTDQKVDRRLRDLVGGGKGVRASDPLPSGLCKTSPLLVV